MTTRNWNFEKNNSVLFSTELFSLCCSFRNNAL